MAYGYYECNCGRSGNSRINLERGDIFIAEGICPNCKSKIVAELNDYDCEGGFCDLCDYHGSFTVKIICPECKFSFEPEIISI